MPGGTGRFIIRIEECAGAEMHRYIFLRHSGTSWWQPINKIIKNLQKTWIICLYFGEKDGIVNLDDSSVRRFTVRLGCNKLK